MGDADASPAPAAKSKAGRNLPAAIASGVALAVIVILSLFTLKWLFVVVVIGTMLVAVREIVASYRTAAVIAIDVPTVNENSGGSQLEFGMKRPSV